MSKARNSSPASLTSDSEYAGSYSAAAQRGPAKPVSIVDVARACKCSITTVSQVMNGVAKARISKQTRDRVQGILRRLNYSPNRMARALASRKTWTVALVSDYDSQYPIAMAQLEIIAGIQSVLASTHYDLTLVHRHKGAAAARSRGFDGAILLSPRDMEELQPFIDSGIPAIVMEPGFPVPVPSVGIDEAQAVRLQVEHLADLGHRRIGYFGISKSPSSMRLRAEGYRRVMAELGLEPMESLFFHEPEAVFQGLASMPEAIRRDGITAVAFMSDSLAIRALSILQTAGLRVPQEVSVVGIDGSLASQVSLPPLTTVYNAVLERSKRAADMLLARMKNADLPVEHITFGVSLVMRSSTAAPGCDD